MTTYSQSTDQASNAGAIPVRPIPYTAKNITAAATTAVKASPGTLGTVTVNTGGAGSVLTIYDSLTGTGAVLATINTTNALSLSYNVAATIGITAVTANGSPADITIGYL